MEDLKDTIKEIVKYKEELGLNNLSDDMILDCSTRIFNAQIRQEEKENKKPTQKQIDILKKNDMYSENITREEATQMVREIFDKKGNINKRNNQTGYFPDY